MIVVDPSALFCVAFCEAGYRDMEAALAEEDAVIASPSVLEACVVAWRRGGETLRNRIIDIVQTFELDVRDFAANHLSIALDGFDRFGIGRGQTPAALNFGDCFSDALAKALSAPLLFKGSDFSQTDVLVGEASRR